MKVKLKIQFPCVVPKISAVEVADSFQKVNLTQAGVMSSPQTYNTFYVFLYSFHQIIIFQYLVLSYCEGMRSVTVL